MQPINREKWISEHQNEITKYLEPHDQAEGSKWRTLAPTWFTSENKKIFILDRIVNMHTLEMYETPREISTCFKCWALSIGRPLHTLLKTAYHLALPLSIPAEVIRAIISCDREKEGCKDIAYKAFVYAGRSVADIVRTPIAGTILTIIAVVGALTPLLTYCLPNLIHEVRAAAAKVERWMNWGERHNFWTLAHCFQGTDVFEFYNKEKCSQKLEDTIYPSDDPIFVALNNYARFKLINKDGTVLLNCGFCQIRNSET